MRRFDQKTRKKLNEIARKIKEKNEFAKNADYQQARREYVRQQSETVRWNFAFEGQGSNLSTEVWAAFEIHLRFQNQLRLFKKSMEKISPA